MVAPGIRAGAGLIAEFACGLRAACHLSVVAFLISFSPCLPQYYLPNMSGTEKHPPKWKLEYLTFAPARLHPPAGAGAGESLVKFDYPVPLKHLPRSLRNATVTKSKYAPYKMADLTVPSWATLARRLAKTKNEKLRRRFKKYMYMGAGEER